MQLTICYSYFLKVHAHFHFPSLPTPAKKISVLFNLASVGMLQILCRALFSRFIVVEPIPHLSASPVSVYYLFLYKMSKENEK